MPVRRCSLLPDWRLNTVDDKKFAPLVLTLSIDLFSIDAITVSTCDITYIIPQYINHASHPSIERDFSKGSNELLSVRKCNHY